LHDVKWKKAQGFHCRTSMYITYQQEMDFGEAHNDAMNRRLNKYFFQSLPHVELEANQWLREYAMECIVWAQKMTVTCPTATLTVKVSEEDGLANDDIKQVLSVSVAEDSLPSCSWPKSGTEQEPDNTARLYRTVKGAVQMTARMKMISANFTTSSAKRNQMESDTGS